MKLIRLFSDLISIFFIPIKLIVPKKRVVILQTYSRKLYCENTRYLYEFLSEEGSVDAYWVTDHPKIKAYLKSKGWKYITTHNPIKMIWISLLARVVVDSGLGFFNILNLTGGKSVIKITTLHGSGPKATLSRSDDIMTAVRQILNINKFNYVNFTSNYSAYFIGKKTFFLPNDKIITLGYPRCDKYFDHEYVVSRYNEKSVAKSMNSSIGKESKIILYTPTWRPYKYDFPLNNMPDFSAYDFNQWLQSHNLFFFYTVHSNMTPENMPKDLDRMVFIDAALNPLFDINQLMLEVDILLNDYSTTSTDFSILNRPQLFYMPDYDFYDSEKCFVENYKEILPGREVASYDDLKSALVDASSAPESYVQEYQMATNELQRKYYDRGAGDSARRFSSFIQEIM
jgi:CDP-glycerol glycerophosphotransferase (TagB/SpsB family)